MLLSFYWWEYNEKQFFLRVLGGVMNKYFLRTNQLKVTSKTWAKWVMNTISTIWWIFSSTWLRFSILFQYHYKASLCSNIIWWSLSRIRQCLCICDVHMYLFVFKSQRLNQFRIFTAKTYLFSRKNRTDF